MKKLLLIFLFPIILQAQGLTGVLGLLDEPINKGIDTSGSSRVFFVDALYGNDAKDGLSGKTAWKTLNKVNTYGQQSGDSILFRRGQTFTNKTILNDSISYALTIADGVPNMYFGAYGSGDRPIIDGGGLGGARYVFFYWNKTAITSGTTTFRGINFFSPDSSSEAYQGQYGGSGEFYSYETYCFNGWELGTVLIDSCTFDGDGKSYSEMWFSNANADSLPYTITNSLFKGSYAEHGFYCGNMVHPVFEHNEFQDISEAGIKLFNSRGGSIRYNYFNNAQWGVSAFNNDSLTIAYNIFRMDSLSVGMDTTYYPELVLNNVNYGIYFNNANVANKVFNNTFYLDYYVKDFIFINAPSGNSGDVEIKNNIFYVRESKDPSSSSKYFLRHDSDITFESDYNEFFVPDSDAYAGAHRVMWLKESDFYYNLVDWQNGTTNDLNSNFRDGNDTLFTSGANADYTLFTGSPAINRGVDVGETVDYLGNPIIGLPDIGAFESSTPDEADSLIYESDFSSTTSGFATIRTTLVANSDGILDSNDCLLVYASADNNTHTAYLSMVGKCYSGNQYNLKFDYYIPSSQTKVNRMVVYKAYGFPTTTFGSAGIGAWYSGSISHTATADGDYQHFQLYDSNSGATFIGANVSTDDRIYLKNVRLYKVKGIPD